MERVEDQVGAGKIGETARIVLVDLQYKEFRGVVVSSSSSFTDDQRVHASALRLARCVVADAANFDGVKWRRNGNTRAQ